MKKIIIILILIALYACKNSEEPVFILDPSKPVEVGIESIKDDNSNLLINVYMINHQPVSGIQFEIEPKDFFEVDSVFGGRCEQNNFKLYNNKKGKILGFSMKGDFIPESDSSKKERNILLSILAKSKSSIDTIITIVPIIASSSAKKMDCFSIPFEKIGK